MPICGLVITLCSDPATRASTLEALARAPGLSIGESAGLRLPAVQELCPGEDLAQASERLLGLSGVVHLDLVYADYEEGRE
jgi:hypothetical protein